MTFGENLQFLRKRAGLTQEDLAEKADAVTHGYLNRAYAAA